ncbi:MAG TPA: L,D-transpeptidase family protein [Pseudolabrys sp.]|nr:L,D-transpeptidase family protein [Pseudolabrys sp.]
MALLKRPFARALLASAAVIAAVVLAGCDTDSITPTGRAQAPLSEKTLAEMASKNMDKDSPILARIFKEEAEMEIWKKNRDGDYALLKTYPICKWSGDLGPKKKEGDRQAPEGFYTITPGQMNPNSSYYLAFNTGFPNAYDRAMGYTGSQLMVHGDCSSRGCYAMTDEQIQEIYALARESFFGGQKAFQLQAYPFRMTAMNMAKHRNNPNFAFWKMLKEGYDHFNATHQEPKVAVCEKRYVFDAAAPDDSTRALTFNAKGACPVYQLDKTIADAVHEERRQEQLKMAQYIASGVSTVPFRVGDGGMNQVFASKLPTTSGDNNGRLFELTTVASVDPAAVPGALPRTSNRGAVTLTKLQSQQQSAPAVVASVPLPHPAPQPKEGEAPAEQPTSIAGLIGNLFGSSKSEPAAAPPPSQREQVATHSTVLAAKPKQAAPSHAASTSVRTASAGSSPWPSQPAPSPWPEPKPPVEAAPAAKPAPVQQAAKAEPPRAEPPRPEIRTAYTTPPASNNGLLSGAQPVVPAGTFNTFR